ncbi:MAG: 2Fe-2S iron-sulfur cluster-binding protein [Mycobacteriales bacterium]
MPKVFFVSPDGMERAVDGTAGDSVMTTAVRHGVPGIVGQCGGTLSCATCHVFVDADDLPVLPAMTDDEDEMLDCAATDRERGSRLSCQLVLVDGVDLHIRIPADQQ